MTEAHECYKNYYQKVYTRSKRKTPAQRKHLAKLKDKLKVSVKKGNIINKKFDKFLNEHKEIVDKYNALINELDSRYEMSTDIESAIKDYNERFITREVDIDE